MWGRVSGEEGEVGRTYCFAGESLIYQLGVRTDAEVWNGWVIGK